MRLATICARAGSKRLSGKNTRRLCGVRLFMLTIWQAIDSRCFDMIIVSTDDETIKLDVLDSTRPVLLTKRPAELANDTAGKVPAIRHALLEAERITGQTFGYIVDLDVTAPLRTLDDIRGFCAKLDEIGIGGLVSVTPSRHSPYFNTVRVIDGRARLIEPSPPQILRGQDAPPTYDLNASMTGWSRGYLMRGTDHPVSWNTHIYEMPPERSWDIDTILDFEIVEFLMSRQKAQAA